MTCSEYTPAGVLAASVTAEAPEKAPTVTDTLSPASTPLKVAAPSVAVVP